MQLLSPNAVSFIKHYLEKHVTIALFLHLLYPTTPTLSRHTEKKLTPPVYSPIPDTGLFYLMGFSGALQKSGSCPISEPALSYFDRSHI